MYTGTVLGDPQVAPTVAPTTTTALVRHLQCSDAQLAQATTSAGRSLGAAEVRTILEEAVREAVKLAREGAGPISGQRAKFFEAVFSVPPGWHPSGVNWVLGGVIRKRLTLAATLLTSRTIRFSCFGWPWPSATPDAPDAYLVRAEGGVYRVGLGTKFWRLLQTDDRASMACGILGAALRISFGDLVRLTPNAKPKNLSYCYMRYVLHVSGRMIPVWIGDGCPIPPARWNRLMPSPAESGPPTTSPNPAPPPPVKPPRLRLTDEEIERILGRKIIDPISDHIDGIIRQAVPTGIARPSLGDQLKRKLDEGADSVSSRLGVPQKYRKYVRKIARGAAEKGSKLIVEEGLKEIGVDNKEAIEAVWGVVERVAKEKP
jgi:hypothetical protein